MFSYLVLWPVTIPLTVGLYVILTRPRPRRLAVAGLPLIIISTALQMLHWKTAYSPYIPWIMPSLGVLMLSALTAIGLLEFANRRDSHPAFALFGAIPLLGPLVALLLLAPKRITIDPVPTSRHGMTVLVFATILIGNMWVTLVERIETSEAPDRKTRLLITAPPAWDQNYRFELQHLSGPLITAAERIYTSPDEVRMPLRILWSTDGTHVLVEGPKFWVVEHATLASGQRLYIHFDDTQQSVWSNAIQDNRNPRFTEQDLQGIRWTEPL